MRFCIRITSRWFGLGERFWKVGKFRKFWIEIKSVTCRTLRRNLFGKSSKKITSQMMIIHIGAPATYHPHFVGFKRRTQDPTNIIFREKRWDENTFLSSCNKHTNDFWLCQKNLPFSHSSKLGPQPEKRHNFPFKKHSFPSWRNWKAAAKYIFVINEAFSTSLGGRRAKNVCGKFPPLT